MKPGQTQRFDCSDCNVEFEVCLEPKAKDQKVKGLVSNKVQWCPFCGGEHIETYEDE